MADAETLDYSRAVQLADEALTAILEQVRRPAPNVYTGEEISRIAAAFDSWLLGEHEEVFDALVKRYDTTAQNVDEYILYYSAAYTITFLYDGDELGSAEIRRRIVH